MSGVISFLQEGLGSLWSPEHAESVLLWIFVLVAASGFIYLFYKSTSKRNLISLNLKKYNSSEHPLFKKVFAGLFYLLEYVIIMPVLLLLWYAALSAVLMFLTEGENFDRILLISAAVVGAARVLAYYHKEISKDLAKLFPFIAVSVFLLSPDDFTPSIVWGKFLQLPELFSQIFSFILVVAFVEIVLRAIYTIYEFWESEENVAELSKETVGQE